MQFNGGQQKQKMRLSFGLGELERQTDKVQLSS